MSSSAAESEAKDAQRVQARAMEVCLSLELAGPKRRSPASTPRPLALAVQAGRGQEPGEDGRGGAALQHRLPRAEEEGQEEPRPSVQAFEGGARGAAARRQDGPGDSQDAAGGSEAERGAPARAVHQPTRDGRLRARRRPPRGSARADDFSRHQSA
eukprot:3451688-Prymnesium_polylepis.1